MKLFQLRESYPYIRLERESVNWPEMSRSKSGEIQVRQGINETIISVGKSNETTMLTGFSERQDVLELVSELKDYLALD